MFDVCVTQLLRRLGRAQIGTALRTAAISDDEGVFIRWQAGRQIILDGGKAKRARHMAGLVGIGAVGVNDHGRLGVCGRQNVLGTDVGKFAGLTRPGAFPLASV